MIVRRNCGRCQSYLWMTKEECEQNPRVVVCSDCQHYYQTNPDASEREFQQEQRRADADSIAMRARWAAQDAAKKGAVA